MKKNSSNNNGDSSTSGKCVHCSGKCCRYTLVDLPTPRSRLDFDNYAWYLAHENLAIYKDGKQWYLAINTKCRYLNDDNKCDVYEKRFQACRDHTDDNCEYDGIYEPDLTFTCPFELLKFAEKRFKKMGKKKPKRKASVNK
ncbi:MAG: YkgJ family cysteine cluster protein [candidate division Zixibacteria bacterium]|nr:YkgJ family cysteine cluster protein [candidate division Zixibacteria bacterium]